MTADSRVELFNEHRSLLFSIAYRMCGSIADAEDMLQEAFIRWQQVSDIAIDSPRAYLVTIVSRLCINHLQSARVQREEYVGQWLPEPLVTAHSTAQEPGLPEGLDESLSMAFLVLMERLTPAELIDFCAGMEMPRASIGGREDIYRRRNTARRRLRRFRGE